MHALAEAPVSKTVTVRPSPSFHPPTAPLIEARGVCKNFGDKTVIGGVDLSLAAGEIVAIVGCSECGKSTLLRLLAGLEGASG